MTAIPCIAWNLEFILRPLLSYVLLAAGLGLCLYLFATLKAEIRDLLRRYLEERQQVQALAAALGEARIVVQELGADVRAMELQTGMLVAPAAARSGLNLTKRTQVLRMHRGGQDSVGIAAALALPRAEVELMIKVHRIAVEKT
jgi:hypothetical protein